MSVVSKYLNGVGPSLNLLRQNQEVEEVEVDTRIDSFKNSGYALCYKNAIAFDRTKLEDMHRYI